VLQELVVAPNYVNTELVVPILRLVAFTTEDFALVVLPVVLQRNEQFHGALFSNGQFLADDVAYSAKQGLLIEAIVNKTYYNQL